MPELPEVETVRRELEPWLAGRTILHAARRDAPAGPKYAHLERASGQRILAVNRRGKFMLLPLSEGDELVVHLGMTGRISPRDPRTHVRVELELGGKVPAGQRRLFFQDARRFGRFLVVPAGDYRSLPTLHHLGPEPLEPTFTAAVLREGLRGSRAPIKAFLLGQRPVAGVGNIYADEALWRAGIHPLTASRRISSARVAALRDAIVDLLQAAIDARGTTFSDYRTVGGDLGGYANQLLVYGRESEPCRRCGAILRRIVVGQRSSCFCPRCQRR